MHYREVYFLECQAIINSLFIRMVGDTDLAISYGDNDIFNIHLCLSLSG